MIPRRPALSIAIPTYNRAALLHRLLESVEQAISSADDGRVEVVVSDNASTDDTPAILRHWQSRLPIVVHRQSVNVGYERNFATLVTLSSGDYVWTAGDDDLLADRVLDWLLPLVERGESDLYVVPAARSDAPEQNTARFFGLSIPQRAPLRYFLNRFGLFGILGGVGHAVFRRSGLAHVDRFLTFGSFYVHAFALAASFHDRPAEMLTQTAFLTPVKDQAEAEVYALRWRSEAGDHPMGLVRASLDLGRLGLFEERPPPSFFKRYFNEPWPIHYIVYHELARRIFFEVYRPAEADWADLDRFFALLGDPGYASIFAEIRRSFLDLEAARQRMSDLCGRPPVIDFGPASPASRFV